MQEIILRKSGLWFSFFAAVLSIPFSLIQIRSITLSEELILFFFQGLLPLIFAYILGKKWGKVIFEDPNLRKSKSSSVGIRIALVSGVLSTLLTYILGLPLVYFKILHYRLISRVMVNFIIGIPIYVFWGALAGFVLQAYISKKNDV